VIGTAVELAVFDAEIAERVLPSPRGPEKMPADLIRSGRP